VGSSNNAQSQNAAANQQVQQNTQQAQTNLSNWLAANPGVLGGAPQSIAGPQQFGGAQGGGTFGPRPQANMPRVAPAPQPGAPKPAPAPGQPQQQMQIPPGLLGLLGGMPRTSGQ
jgi:hypothetical protein